MKIFSQFTIFEQLALALKNRVCPEFTVLNIDFLLFRMFEQLALALKTEFPLEFFTALNMYFLSFRIFEQLALALKNRVSLKIFTGWNILYTIRIFEQLTLALKKRVCPGIFHCIEYVFSIIQDFWATCACSEKQSCPENFHCIEYTFYIQDFWVTCACPEKQKVPWIHCTDYVFFIIQDFWQLALSLKNRVWPGIFHWMEYVFFIIQDFWATCTWPEKQSLLWIFTVWNILFTIRIFEQLALALKNRVCPEVFHCIEYVVVIIQYFWATCACPEKQSCPENFHCIEYTFCIQDFWVTCACPEKQKVPWIHCTEYVFFIIQDFWASCACPENRVCPENFQARGAAAAPPTRTPMLIRRCVKPAVKLITNDEACSSSICLVLWELHLYFELNLNFERKRLTECCRYRMLDVHVRFLHMFVRTSSRFWAQP